MWWNIAWLNAVQSGAKLFAGDIFEVEGIGGEFFCSFGLERKNAGEMNSIPLELCDDAAVLDAWAKGVVGALHRRDFHLSRT